MQQANAQKVWGILLLAAAGLLVAGNLPAGFPMQAVADSALNEAGERECPFDPVEAIDLPLKLRQSNYGGGSCMHASMINVLRQQGLYQLADKWRREHWGAAGVWDLARLSEQEGLKYAYTTEGDEKLLEWCGRTKRWAAIHYFPAHAINFCGFVQRDGQETAVLLDNNRPERYLYVPKQEFIRRWRGYGGCALTVVYTPPAPKPWK